MKRDLPDFHTVRDNHVAIHERLLNWARYVRTGGSRAAWGTQPMFMAYRSSEVWGQEPMVPIDQIDGHALEKAVGQLPEKHRAAIRWHYVYTWVQPGRVQRFLAVTRDGLCELVHDGRAILNNRNRK